MVELRDSINHFVQDYVLPNRSMFDAGETIKPQEFISFLSDSKLDSHLFPRSGRLSLPSLLEATLEVSKHCSNTRNVLLVGFGMFAGVLLDLDEKPPFVSDLMGRFLARPFVGAVAITPDSGSPGQVEGSFESGGLRIRAVKPWVTLGEIADFFLVALSTKDSRVLALVSRDDPGVIVEQIAGLSGNRGSGIARLEMTDVWLPSERLVSQGTPAGLIERRQIRVGRLLAAASALGVAQSSLRIAVQRLSQRGFTASGSWKSRIGQQWASIQSLTVAIRSLAKQPIQLDTLSDPYTAAKVMCSRIVGDCARLATEASGGRAFLAGDEANWLWRESLGFEYIEGANEPLRLYLANQFTLSEV